MVNYKRGKQINKASFIIIFHGDVFSDTQCKQKTNVIHIDATKKAAFQVHCSHGKDVSNDSTLMPYRP